MQVLLLEVIDALNIVDPTHHLQGDGGGSTRLKIYGKLVKQRRQSGIVDNDLCTRALGHLVQHVVLLI